MLSNAQKSRLVIYPTAERLKDRSVKRKNKEKEFADVVIQTCVMNDKQHNQGVA